MLEAVDLSSGYLEDILVLRGVSVAAQKGRITCIIGANGVGKSTLLKTIFGLLKPIGGHVTFDGVDITGQDPSLLIKMGISFVPQLRSVFPHMTVHENLEVGGGWPLRKKPIEIEETIQSIYKRYPALEKDKRRKAGDLSGGQQRLLEIARSLVTNPNTMLIDEPTAGLAPQISVSIYKELVKLRDDGVTILLVDQNISAAVTISDYVYVLEMGRNKLAGPKENFEGRLEEVVREMFA